MKAIYAALICASIVGLNSSEYWIEFNAHPDDGIQLPMWMSPRAFTVEDTVYVNDDAWYFDEKDKELLIAHEEGHIQGKEHTLFGIMSPFSFVRYITS